ATAAPTTPPPTTRTSNDSFRIRSRFAARVRAENSVTAIPSSPTRRPHALTSRASNMARSESADKDVPLGSFLALSQRIQLGGTMGPHREGTGYDRRPGSDPESPGNVQSVRPPNRDDWLAFGPRRVRWGGRRGIPDPGDLRERPGDSVRPLLSRAAGQGRPRGPRDGRRGDRPLEVSRGLERENAGPSSQGERGLHPESLLHLVLRPRRDRTDVPGPPLPESEPPADGGAGRRTQLLLGPRESRASGAGENRRPEGHRWSRHRQVASQGQEARAGILHRGELQGIQGEVRGAPQTGRHLDEGPGQVSDRAIHHRADLQLRFLLFPDRRAGREARTPRGRLA